MGNRTPTSFLLSDEEVNILKKLRDLTGLSASAVFRLLLREGLAARGQGTMPDPPKRKPRKATLGELVEVFDERGWKLVRAESSSSFNFFEEDEGYSRPHIPSIVLLMEKEYSLIASCRLIETAFSVMANRYMGVSREDLFDGTPPKEIAS